MTADLLFRSVLTLGLIFASTEVFAGGKSCNKLPSHADVQSLLKVVQAEANGGFGLNVWATVVNRDGEVCVVAFSGDDRCDQWPRSRAISTPAHNIAWKIRHGLNLDNVPAGGVSASGDDNIVNDIGSDDDGRNLRASGWGHPECSVAATGIAGGLPTTRPIGGNP